MAAYVGGWARLNVASPRAASADDQPVEICQSNVASSAKAVGGFATEERRQWNAKLSE